MMRYIKAGILGGIVLFIWGFVSWMLLPWHSLTIRHFNSEVAVSQTIESNAPTSGIYILPSTPGSNNPQQPMVFASVRFGGMPSMAMPMVISLITQIVAAFFAAWLLGCTTRLNYIERVLFVLGIAFVATLIADVPAWNWFGFDPQYTLVMIADTLIGWFLAGLVLARYVR